jgi:hypothetical protein
MLTILKQIQSVSIEIHVAQSFVFNVKLETKFKIFIIRFQNFQNDKIFQIFNEKCSKFS